MCKKMVRKIISHSGEIVCAYDDGTGTSTASMISVCLSDPGANSLLSMTTGSEKPGKSASNVPAGVLAMKVLQCVKK